MSQTVLRRQKKLKSRSKRRAGSGKLLKSFQTQSKCKADADTPTIARCLGSLERLEQIHITSKRSNIVCLETIQLTPTPGKVAVVSTRRSTRQTMPAKGKTVSATRSTVYVVNGWPCSNPLPTLAKPALLWLPPPSPLQDQWKGSWWLIKPPIRLW